MDGRAMRNTTRGLFLHDDDTSSVLANSSKPLFRRHCNFDTLRGWQNAIRSSQPQRSSDNPLRTYSTCAVVGSSGSLLLRPRGRLIDSHEAVFRINDAQVAGYERYVGARTAIRIWGAMPLPWRRTDWNASEAASLLIYCQPASWLSQCWTTIPERPFPRISPLMWEAVRTRLRAETNRTTVGTYPSTGIIAVMVALRLCSRVTIFGFGNGSFDCARPNDPPACSHYDGFKLNESLLYCGSADNPLFRMEDYVRQSAFHDMEMEREWLTREVAAGRLHTAPCRPRQRQQRLRNATD